MNNVISLHPPKSNIINLYEVVGEDGIAIWGGNDTNQAIQYLRQSPAGSRLLVSGWESDEEDAHLIGQSLDITKLVKSVTEAVK